MSIPEQIQKDIVEAMRAREEHRLSTLRMVKSALKNKEIDKRSPLDEKEALAVLSTLADEAGHSFLEVQKHLEAQEREIVT